MVILGGWFIMVLPTLLQDNHDYPFTLEQCRRRMGLSQHGPGAVVEAKSLKKAFEKERMTRQNAEYLVRSLVNGWVCMVIFLRLAVEAMTEITQTIWIPDYLPE